MSEGCAVTLVNLLPWGVLTAVGLSLENKLPLALGRFVLGYIQSHRKKLLARLRSSSWDLTCGRKVGHILE